ncbi:hypothetical protein ACFWY9_13900 [Amycolatopsis sp. NPDC059027]|uniref:hypothetical protein n=1 Tax=unclassified Amycolatopsis TaxID=2618356 RepID=UPI003670EDAD
MRKFVKVLTVISFLLCVAGGLLWWKHTGANPVCDGKDMRPGDVCQRIRAGTSMSYDEAKASLEDSVPVDMGLFFGGGAVFVLSLIGGVYLRRANTRTS